MSGPLSFVVRAAVAPINAEPSLRSEQVSQTLAGHFLVGLEERPSWLRVRARDGYEGWVNRGYLSAAAERDSAAHSSAGRVSLGCTVRDPDGSERALPLGAVLTGDVLVENGCALTPQELRERFPTEPDAIARSARELFAGAPYQWGGITPWGADCSGFVQSIFGLHGIQLPRDASRQAELGTPVVDGISALRPADLLFFSERPDQRATHVALALSPNSFAHVALGRGGHAVEHLDDPADPYVVQLMGRCTGVRRL